MKKNNTILITGGLGFIGTHLVLALMKSNYKIIVFDNFSNSNNFLINIINNKIKIIKGDIRDYHAMLQKLTKFKIDVIIHLAAIHYIPYCDNNPNKTIDVNLSGTVNMLRFAENKKINRFIFTSTADVYKDLKRPCSEIDIIGNKTIYAISKILDEKAIQLYTQERKINFCIFRLFNVYGSKDKTPHFIPSIIKQIKTGRTINHGNINTIRDYIHIDDVVAAFTKIINSRTLPNAVFNIGSGHGYSGKEIIEIIKKIIKRELILHKNKKLSRSIDRHILVANNKLFSNTYSWHPKVKITDGLERMLR
ncbi:MAG: NAD(P)-dependent oxidoreductase [Bacteroidota bacterium]